MKWYYFLILLVFISCQSEKSEEGDKLVREMQHEDYCRGCYKEDSLLFYDPNNGFGTGYDDFKNTWFRDPKNLKVLHETLKSIGYLNYFESNLSEFTDYDSHRKTNICELIHFFISKDCNELLDSIYLTHENYESSSNYYKEFWLRRKKEGNDSIVFVIISDVKRIFESGREIKADKNFVNSELAFQLEGLKSFERDTSLNKQSVLLYFNFFKEIGWHQSAFHFIAKNSKTKGINLNLDSLILTLEKREGKFEGYNFEPLIDNELDPWDECDHHNHK